MGQNLTEENETSFAQGRANERELSLVREVPSGLIGCALAALSKWMGGRREIQTGTFLLHESVQRP